MLCIWLAVLTFSASFSSLAQQNDHIEARIAAERDAEADTDRFLWAGGTFALSAVGGCLLGSVGLVAASLHSPATPSHRLIGKSPEYIMFYTETYKEKVEDLQVTSSFLGCLGGTVVAVIIWAPYYSN